MVRIAPLAFISLVTALPSMGYITGFNVTSKPVSAGETIRVSFQEHNYITQNVDYYAAFGINSQYKNTLGQYLETGVDLTKDGISSTHSGPTNYVTYKIKLPSPLNVDSGSKFNFTTAIFSAVGASGGVGTKFFQHTLTAK